MGKNNTAATNAAERAAERVAEVPGAPAGTVATVRDLAPDMTEAEALSGEVQDAEAAFLGDKPFILVICRKPGFRRAGFAHPERARYPQNAFTAEQLDQLLDEPNLEVVEIGGPAIPRAERLFGATVPAPRGPDAFTAGRELEAAISEAPNARAGGRRGRIR